MPRKTRTYVPGFPVHVVQRGHNRKPTFFSDSDFNLYRQYLFEGLRRYDTVMHAYCLMTNHVHLLVTPAHEHSISRLVQYVAGRYVRDINRRYRRTGTLWEGRHKGSIIEADRYLLATYRYIEMNPVAAGMVEHPAEFRWSSYRHNALGEKDALITPHRVYTSLAVTPRHVCKNYRKLFQVHANRKDLVRIRSALRASYPLGDDRFRREIERVSGKPVGQMTPGGARLRKKQAL